MSVQDYGQTFRATRLWRWIKPIGQSRVLEALSLVLIGQVADLLLVWAVLEHFLCLLLVERATHAPVGGLHGEYAGTTDPPPLPHALLDEGMLLISFCCYVGHIKARKL